MHERDNGRVEARRAAMHRRLTNLRTLSAATTAEQPAMGEVSGSGDDRTGLADSPPVLLHEPETPLSGVAGAR